MQRELKAYLVDILEEIALSEMYAGTHTRDEFLRDRFAQRAIERNFEIIGEALKQAAAMYPRQLEDLPKLSQAIRFRDRLAHGYFSIDPEIVWSALNAIRASRCGETSSAAGLNLDAERP